MVGTQKSSTRALRIQNCLVLAANITAESLNFWLIKLVMEQSLIAELHARASRARGRSTIAK